MQEPCHKGHKINIDTTFLAQCNNIYRYMYKSNYIFTTKLSLPSVQEHETNNFTYPFPTGAIYVHETE